MPRQDRTRRTGGPETRVGPEGTLDPILPQGGGGCEEEGTRGDTERWSVQVISTHKCHRQGDLTAEDSRTVQQGTRRGTDLVVAVYFLRAVYKLLTYSLWSRPCSVVLTPPRPAPHPLPLSLLPSLPFFSSFFLTLPFPFPPCPSPSTVEP